MQRYKRTDRVSELIMREVSVIIDRELRDTRIAMVTVTGVDVTKDLKQAKVFVSVLGGEQETDSSIEALNNAASYIRMLLSERIQLRHIPALTFYFDSSTIYGMKMDKILDSLHDDEE